MRRQGVLVLGLYLLLTVLLMGWIGRRYELVYFGEYGHAVLFCPGVDALRM